MVAKLLLLNVLCFMPFCHAMDSTKSSEQTPLVQKTGVVAQIPHIERHEHILFIPLQYVRPSFETLKTDVEKQQQIHNNLSECTLFRIGLLSDELRKKIVMYAVDHHEKATEKFVRMPIQQVYEIYNEIRKHGPIFIGDTMLSEHMLFAMNPAERTECYKLRKPSLFDRYFLGISHEITQKEYDFLSEQRRNGALQEDIENVRVIPERSWSRDDCKYKVTVACAPSLFLATSAGLGVACAVTGHLSYLAGMVVFLASGGIVFTFTQACLKKSVVADGFITQIKKEHNEEELIVLSEGDN